MPVALWLIALALAGRQTYAVLRLPPDRRLTDLAGWLGGAGGEGVLRPVGSLYEGGTFSGTPLAGLVLRPLANAGQQGLGVVWTLGTLLLVCALGVLAARAVPGLTSRRARLVAAPVAISLLVLSVPVRSTFSLGQTSIIPVLLVLGAVLHGRSAPRPAGVVAGLAAALQPSMLLFAPLLWLTGRRQEAAAAGAGFAGFTLLAWAAAPADSWAYWVHHVAGVGLGGASDGLSNQSLHGLLLRLGLSGPLEIALFAVLAATVAVVGLRRAAHYARDGQLLLAAALTGCVAVAVAPVAWQHQQLWILLAAVGRVGSRRGDRYVWPVFLVLVMTLNADALVPKIAWLAPLGENAPLLAALLAACVLPFLRRDAPTWDRPEPSGVFSRPNLMLELLLIRVGYFAYSYVRSLAPDGRGPAESHGRQILAVEQALGIDIEYGLNQLVARTSWLADGMNFYYGAFHFLVPVTLLVGLYLRAPASYRWARTSLSFATLLGLVGFWLYPLAPPRLMPGLGYVDTMHGPQDFDDPDFGVLTGISNQYAAMPSLHVGWSLWAAVVIIRITPNLWLRLLGALYPLLTTVVVMGTANHYLLDAVGGAAVVAAGFAVAALWHRHGPGSAERAATGGGTAGAGAAAGAAESAGVPAQTARAVAAEQADGTRRPAAASAAAGPGTGREAERAPGAPGRARPGSA
ncbi:bifunctional glycosyltransferase 87/phosphatase PAP2 family protein [Streptomyces sp. 549]|uniref:bifunctional glycosyltransferase 87/phosphatase PAP2 family protein n=1 Tax=Streptomyces sp. 549 TaxID=3049076 RepID=UPI0024C2F3AB|nr:bifunctional glycosyltransferase 87/phosphatase PAP2 family protein [Streptomyces sp. 549]MDK1474003.1 bifunctional glycosyltransferase 87/phosphatase PAP2 family protein [Streptomyces sp. 549]